MRDMVRKSIGPGVAALALAACTAAPQAPTNEAGRVVGFSQTNGIAFYVARTGPGGAVSVCTYVNTSGSGVGPYELRGCADLPTPAASL